MKQFFAALLVTLCANFSFAEGRISVTPENQFDEVSSIDYYNYNFGRVMINSYNTVRYTVSNLSDEKLVFQRANIWGMFFDARHNCRAGLQPKQKCQFEISYWPAFSGYHSGEFQMDFVGDSVNVRVSGQAYENYP